MIDAISDSIRQPWPWYVSGFMIALVLAFMLFTGKTFGFSSNLRTLCTLCGAGRKWAFFNFNWKDQAWNLLFLLGSILGGFITSHFLENGQALKLASSTVQDIQKIGINFTGEMQPGQLFGPEALLSVKGILILITGGFLVGFGSRYAGGCTSGHAITGLSNLQKPSLIAVAGFFIGGLIMTHLLLPLIF
ncbi:YeeE/YedE family protein [Pararcticibacter amylolyticus]|uniref:YeeE/YedE family protein n=1 Tax=Pararcticibacter amylolyticus TaxID=2173175 RepID=A0A2U2PE42_9SPHI|nr:YeeE/YedE thiosulfate transporter family protein [Pararcticibacter amylolyticus]PWG79667.1 YeeE/YedE family protein [Pararcticibacter amylolyticus]